MQTTELVNIHMNSIFNSWYHFQNDFNWMWFNALHFLYNSSVSFACLVLVDDQISFAINFIFVWLKHDEKIFLYSTSTSRRDININFQFSHLPHQKQHIDFTWVEFMSCFGKVKDSSSLLVVQLKYNDCWWNENCIRKFCLEMSILHMMENS